MISPTFEVEGMPAGFPEASIAKGPGRVLGYLFVVSQPNLSALGKVGCMIANGVLQAGFAREVGKIGLSFERPLP